MPPFDSTLTSPLDCSSSSAAPTTDAAPAVLSSMSDVAMAEMTGAYTRAELPAVSTMAVSELRVSVPAPPPAPWKALMARSSPLNVAASLTV